MRWVVNVDFLLSNVYYVVPFATFAFVTLAAYQVGEFFKRWNLPLISGYLLAGAIAGPFVLDFIHAEGIGNLRFIDEVSLAFIAFAAGSELYLKELRSRFESITWITTGLVSVTFILSSIAVYLLGDFVPFMQDMDNTSRLAVAILAGAILVARSPSSAIAIVNELRAKGTFTKTVLGVTVVMDVVVIVVFAINASLADALLTNMGINLTLLLLLVIELLLSLTGGYALSKILQFTLSIHIDKALKSFIILLVGFTVFVLSDQLRHFTHDNLSFEILLEPLLICMIGSFLVTNFSSYRDEFMEILDRVGPIIFVIFFTLTGASLSLDTLVTIWPFALILFGVRLGAIMIGSFSGGVIAGDSIRYNRVGWMAYITQAGVGLGLAKEVADEFPEFGNEFATLIIAVIVLNQVVGPPFFKFAIKHVGEAHTKGKSEPDEIRNVLIVGIENQSHALAEELRVHNWQVILADVNPSHVTESADDGIQMHLLSEISESSLSEIVTSSVDAVVAMLHDDLANLRLCELMYEKYGVKRMVVRLNEYDLVNHFKALGVVIVNPSSAMVHLLDTAVRAPQLASYLLHDDPEREVAQITVSDPDIEGLYLRDLILPNDVLVMSVRRGGHSIVPHGYTILHVNDEVTLVGSPNSLEEVTLKLGY